MKKLIALLLAMAMCLCLLAACGSSTDTAAEKTETSAEAGTQPAEEEAAEAEEAEAEPEAEDAEEASEPEESEEDEEDEIVEIEFYLMGVNDDYDVDRIAEKINELAEEAIGVHANFHFISMGNWATQIPMALAANETIDLLALTPIAATSFNVLQSNGQLLDISGMLEENAPETYELVQAYLDAYTVNGGVYGVPAYRIYTTNFYFMTRQDILQELGIEEEALAIDTWSGYEDLLKTFQEAYADSGEVIYPTMKGISLSVLHRNGTHLVVSDNFSDCLNYEYLGDSLSCVYVDENNVVQNYFATDYYKAECELVAKWYEEGLVYTDSPYMTDLPSDYVGKGMVFSWPLETEMGSDINGYSSYSNYPFDYIKVSSGRITSSSLTCWGVGVPFTAAEPEAALKFLNLFYSSEEFMNLYVYGIEGEDYQVVDGVEEYADGVDADSATYAGMDYQFGNQFLALPRSPQSSDFRERALEANLSAEISQCLGVSVDVTALSEVVAGISSAADEYRQILECGTYTEEAYTDFLAKLDAAGIDEYLAAYQAALDAYIG